MPSIIQYELHRYKQKGPVHTAIGLATVALFFIGFPIFGKYLVGQTIEDWLDKQKVENYKWHFIILMTSLHLLFTLGNFAYYLPLYLQKIPAFEKYRINRIQDWEWNKKNWPELKSRLIKTYFLNHLILLPGLIMIDLFVRGGDIAFRADLLSWPSLTEFFKQIMFCILVDDTAFYWAHYIFHTPALYKTIHKKHHEYKNPFSLAGEFDSVYEYFLAGTLPPLMAFSFLGNRAHMFTYLCYVFLKIGKQADQHCGYELPFSVYHVLPFTGSGISHNFHHTHNEGSIGSFFSIWDHIMKTDQEFMKYYFAYYKRKEIEQTANKLSAKAKAS